MTEKKIHTNSPVSWPIIAPQPLEPNHSSHKLFILLSRFPDIGSKLLGVISRCYYTHASIGLSEDTNTFYSFVNPKGFLVEKIDRYLRPDREPFPCVLYEIPVSIDVYNAAKEILQDFEERKHALHYTFWGLVLSLFRIPYKKRNAYFCSQFVAEVLRKSGAVDLPKRDFWYLPADLEKLDCLHCRFSGNHFTMRYSVHPV